jgi:hypothetical protein
MTYWSVDKWGMPANQLSRCGLCDVLQTAIHAWQQRSNIQQLLLALGKHPIKRMRGIGVLYHVLDAAEQLALSGPMLQTLRLQVAVR